jgi:hypothetical protein
MQERRLPDYRLEELSSRTFEQLVQALAVHVMGSGISVFGDGPDGAREATFAGKVSYPNAKASWKGRGVIQAKFRQRPAATPSRNTSWLIAQIRREMRKYRRPGSRVRTGLRPPDYYVLATNVSLSARRKTGGRDRVENVLKQYQAKLRWKGFALWDANSLARFLDGAPGIRQTYAAFITSSDVLHAALGKLQPPQIDFHTVLANYLQKEIWAAQYANVQQAGHSSETRIRLADVIIDLPVGTIRERGPMLGSSSDAAESHLSLQRALLEVGLRKPEEAAERRATFLSVLFAIGDLDLTASTGATPPSLSHLTAPGYGLTVTSKFLREHRDKEVITVPDPGPVLQRDAHMSAGRIVLLGGPGQGKTTIALYACQLYRAALLWQVHAAQPSAIRELVAKARPSDHSRLPQPSKLRYPVQIDLKSLAGYLRSSAGAERTLLDFLASMLCTRTGQAVEPAMLRQWLRDHPWFIVFDGLDEIRVAVQRTQAVRCISEFVLDIDALDADVLVLVTCRSRSYASELDYRQYDHLQLMPLSEDLALTYARQLLEARHGAGSSAVETSLQRLRQAAKIRATDRIMRSPLQVTIMAALVDKIGTPPQQRWRLFSEYYRVIYDRETERDTAWSDVLRNYRAEVDLIHREVGWILQGDPIDEEDPKSSITIDRFKAVVRSRLAKEGHQRGDLIELTHLLAEAVQDRLVLITTVGDGQLGYETRSFQEFMAANFLLDAPDAQQHERNEQICRSIAQISAASHWRNTMLFAAGRIYQQDRHLRDSLEAQCVRMNELEHDVPLAYELAGSQLALEMLEDGCTQSLPENSRSLMRCAARLLDRRAHSFGVRLARCANSYTESVLIDELSRRLRSTNPARSAVAWTTVLVGLREKLEWARHCHLRFWPSDARALLAELLGPDEQWEFWEKTWALPQAFPQMSLDALRNLARDDTGELHLSTLEDGKFAALAREAITSHLPPIAVSFKLTSSKTNASGRAQKRRIKTNLAFLMSPLLVPASEPPSPEEARDWHWNWRIYAAGVRFSANPNPETLANELAIIRDAWDEVAGDDLILKLPWPIVSILTSCDSAAQLDEQIEAVRAGRYGTLKTWQQLQSRWCADGVDVEDIIGKPSSVDRATANLLPFPFPADARAMSILESIGTGTLPAICDALEKLDSPADRKRLGRLAQELQRTAFSEGHPRAMETFQRLVTLGIPIEPDTAIAAMTTSTPNESELAAYDHVGRQTFAAPGHYAFYPTYFAGQEVSVETMLAGEYLRNPALSGLARILSFCNPEWAETVSIPVALLRAQWEAGRISRTTFLVLKLDQLAIDANEAMSVAREVIESLKERPDLLRRILTVLTNSFGTTLARELFLTELLRQLEDISEPLAPRGFKTLLALTARRDIVLPGDHGSIVAPVK